MPEICEMLQDSPDILTSGLSELGMVRLIAQMRAKMYEALDDNGNNNKRKNNSGSNGFDLWGVDPSLIIALAGF